MLVVRNRGREPWPHEMTSFRDEMQLALRLAMDALPLDSQRCESRFGSLGVQCPESPAYVATLTCDGSTEALAARLCVFCAAAARQGKMRCRNCCWPYPPRRHDRRVLNLHHRSVLEQA